MDFTGLSIKSILDKNFQTHFYKIAEVIGKKNLPLVVDNYNNILYNIPDFSLKPLSNLFFIGHDDYEPGEKAGTYLASMGHKQIAYFCFGNWPGNIHHFKGVESAIKKVCSGESNLHYFHDESDDAFWGADLATYRSTPDEEKNRFHKAYSGLFKSYQFQMADPVVGVYPLLANHIKKDLCIKRMTPFFEKAIKMKEITAWVGTGFWDTITAAEYLMERRVDIPNEISLFGFSDGGLCTEYGITSFNFMEDKAAYLAAHCILGDIPIKKNRKGYVEYKGQIMVRKSVKAI
jgi:hypothetical protein